MRILDRWTLTASMALVIAALMACKKEAPPPAPAPAPTPTPTTTASAEPPKDKKDEVKRYGDKERDESGTVLVIYPNAKIYKEADETTSHIATLSKGTMVNRKAAYSNWMLVDWPSGVGELSPGWILNKHLDTKVIKIDLEKVKHQDAGVVVVDAGPAPVADAAVATPDAATTTPDAAAPVADAAAPATKDAGPKGKLGWDKILKTKPK